MDFKPACVTLLDFLNEGHTQNESLPLREKFPVIASANSRHLLPDLFTRTIVTGNSFISQKTHRWSVDTWRFRSKHTKPSTRSNTPLFFQVLAVRQMW